MRKLASIQKIKDLKPIPGADRIVEATILGWHVVVGKNEFKIGDLVVYFETDSVFPDWLKARTGVHDKHLTTRRFKGVYSQGFCIALNKLADKISCSVVGTDVTEALGVKKWEPDALNGGREWWKNRKKKPDKWYFHTKLGSWIYKHFFDKPETGPFPTELVPKTDETRAQVIPDILTKYKGDECNYTEKLDGSSVTFYLEPNKFLGRTMGYKLRVCSRNRMIFDKSHFMYETAEKLKLWMKPGYIYQGEILGPNIQGNKYGLTDYHIYIYQMYSLDLKRYLTPDELSWHWDSGLEFVPNLGTFKLTDDIDQLVEMSKGWSSLSTRKKETPREGIVIRPVAYIDGLDKDKFVGGRLSFKVINPEFLVKYKL